MYSINILEIQRNSYEMQSETDDDFNTAVYDAHRR